MNKKKYAFIFIIILLFLPIVSIATNIIIKSKIDTIEITNVDELSNAIVNQKSNQIWKIKNGIYNLTEQELNKYKNWKNPGTSSQGNWYFPIYEDNITLIGEGNVTITSSVETANGTWATQDFVSIWGDNITINNINFSSKKSQNKAIEIMGKNFILKNSTIKEVIYDNSSNNKVFSGSIYFNPLNNEKDIGNCLLENVYIFAYISASQAQKGNLDVLNLTLNFTNNVWSEWGEGYGPSLIGDVYGKTENITYIVDNNVIWNELVSLDYIYSQDTKPGTIIKLSEDIKLDKSLAITRSDITIDLNSHKIEATSNFSTLKDNQKHLIVLDNVNNVIIKNGTVETNNNNKNGITIADSKAITLENLIINNQSTSAGGIPLSIYNSNTNIKGNLEIHVSDNHLYGINISSTDKNSSLNFENNSYVSIKGKDTLTVINLEGSKENINISGAIIDVGLEMDENGNFVKHNHKFSDIWNYDKDYHWKECICGERVDTFNHILVWIIDKESTTTSKGLKHKECNICGYKEEKVEIPVTGILDNLDEEKNENIASANENNKNNIDHNENSNKEYLNEFRKEEENIIFEDDAYMEKEDIKFFNKSIVGIYFIIVIVFISILIIIILKNYKKA